MSGNDYYFRVIDNLTGEEADIWRIAAEEDWANELLYCDVEGFAIGQDGALFLLDECGRFEYVPPGRFQVVPVEMDRLPEPTIASGIDADWEAFVPKKELRRIFAMLSQNGKISVTEVEVKSDGGNSGEQGV